MPKRKVKYPIRRSVSMSKRTDKYLVKAAAVKGVKPAVMAREIIERGVTPETKLQPTEATD